MNELRSRIDSELLSVDVMIDGSNGPANTHSQVNLDYV